MGIFLCYVLQLHAILQLFQNNKFNFKKFAINMKRNTPQSILSPG